MGISQFFREQIITTKVEFRSYSKRRLFFLGSFALLCFFVLINVFDYISERTIVGLDVYFQGVVSSWQTEPLGSLFSTITFLGSNMFIVSLFFIISVVLMRSHRRKALAAILIALLGSEALILILKELSGRIRPNGCVDGWDCLSFPSGHATLAFYFYGVLAFLVFRFVRWKQWPKTLLITVFAVLAVLIAASRIYLNYHFFTDIVGGFLLGVFWLILVVAMIDFFYQE